MPLSKIGKCTLIALAVFGWLIILRFVEICVRGWIQDK